MKPFIRAVREGNVNLLYCIEKWYIIVKTDYSVFTCYSEPIPLDGKLTRKTFEIWCKMYDACEERFFKNE
jgi:hypothetical protein